jgi:hypothetical protein
MPHLDRPFILTTDWSKVAVGSVLSQKQPITPEEPSSPDREYVVAYASRALTPAESNYAPTEGECLALVWATRKFRQFLHGQHFTVRTDHAALKWLATDRLENSKLERWALRLQEFDFEVEYRMTGNYSSTLIIHTVLLTGKHSHTTCMCLLMIHTTLLYGCNSSHSQTSLCSCKEKERNYDSLR